jgi:hypothetical protein
VGGLPLTTHPGVFLLQLTSATTLKMEVLNGDGMTTCANIATPWAFSANAKTFNR